jgi:hypothetical protein
MDGKTLTSLMLDTLDAPQKDELFHTGERTLYQYLDRAAVDFCRETRCLTKTVALTTVVGQQAYDLPADFIELYLKNRNDRFTVKYYNGADYSWPLLASFDQIFRGNLTDKQENPLRFAIVDKVTQPALITGTTTAAGAKTAGQCILTDGAKAFLTTNLVYPRDVVHNVTDKSDGLVLSVTDATHLVTALFEGKKNAFGNGDSYVIQRATAKQLYLDAPSETPGHTITVPYICMPDPVYSDYGFWRLPAAYCHGIACEAAFLFQNREGDYVSADRHHILFAQEIRRMRSEQARAALQRGSGRY